MIGWIVIGLLLAAFCTWLYRAWMLPALELRARVREILLAHGMVPSATKGVCEQVWRDLRSIEGHMTELSRQAQGGEFGLKTILAGMAEGVIITDQNGLIQVANAACQHMFGLQADPVGRYVMDALRQPEIKHHVDLVLATGKEASGEVVIEDLLDAEHPRKVFQVSVSPLRGAEGNLKGVVAVFHDISRIVQLEELRREFVGNVSHELRTPLAIFKGYLETLLEPPELPADEQLRVLKVMKRHSDRLNALVDDLLTLSRLESGRIVLDFADVSVSHTLQQLCEDWHNQFRTKNCELVRVMAEGVPLLQVDALRLDQVFYNLLDNALKYTEKESRVEVGVVYDRGKKHIDFYVKDDGPGIPSDKIGFIFQRFYRVDRARSRESGGTGLGLAIVKHIVQLHGGWVWAESKLGRGTTVWFRLPTRQDGSIVPEPQGHEHPPIVPAVRAL